MYNTNGSTNGPPLLTVDSALAACGGGITPRTPEILNSLMAMTNPLEYSYPGGGQTNSQVSSIDVDVLHFWCISNRNIRNEMRDNRRLEYFGAKIDQKFVSGRQIRN